MMMSDNDKTNIRDVEPIYHEINSTNKYTTMQKMQYENDAKNWSVYNLDPVVGSFREHNNWSDYDLLFKDISDLKNKSVLDFGCGPGRNLVKYCNTFSRIDGVDIGSKNLENARIWLKYNNIDPTFHKLILCNGVDLKIIDDNQYDIIMSTICFQHICVYEIRLNYLNEFYRILKPGGYITIQMGYGTPSPQTVDYYDNNYDALSTNRGCDTNISDYSYIEKDLVKIGFKNFKFIIRPTGPGDIHPSWIFFNAQKDSDNEDEHAGDEDEKHEDEHAGDEDEKHEDEHAGDEDEKHDDGDEKCE